MQVNHLHKKRKPVADETYYLQIAEGVNMTIDDKNTAKPFSGNMLKLIAIIAMTIDHVTAVLFPDYPTAPVFIILHIIGRLTAPIMWFFIAEGFHYTHNLKNYMFRLFFFAAISHFAYTFAFGIPFIPFRKTVFNQTSVIWALAWGLVALTVNQSSNPRLKPWIKTLCIFGITVITFCADWSSIAVLAIVGIGRYRGNFKKQMASMMMYVSIYAAVYFIFINRVYGIIQLMVALSIPFLAGYNGQRGKWKNMGWFFYVYYPLHLVICGIVRILLHGNVSVMIGG